MGMGTRLIKILVNRAHDAKCLQTKGSKSGIAMGPTTLIIIQLYTRAHIYYKCVGDNELVCYTANQFIIITNTFIYNQ